MKNFFSVMGLLCMLSTSYANEAVQLRTGVILDRTSQSVLAMLPGGGVASYDLQSGKTKWSSANADKPLVIQSSLILSQKRVGQKGLLSLVYQSVKDGAVLKSINLDLPRKVMANIINGAGANFDISLKKNHAESQLEWVFRGKKISGVAPHKDQMLFKAKSNRQSKTSIKRGLINLDFDGQEAVNENTSKGNNLIKSRIEQTVLTNKSGRQFLSQDGKHVLVSKRIESNTSIKYEWQIHNTNGELLGLLEADSSYAPFVVEGKMLLFIAAEKGSFVNNRLARNPPMLTAVDLLTKQTLWKNPIRSTKFFGQLPH